MACEYINKAFLSFMRFAETCEDAESLLYQLRSGLDCGEES